MNMLINICHISVSWRDKKFQVLFDWKAKPWLRAYKTLMRVTKIKIFLWKIHRNRLTFIHENQMRKNESTHINQETLTCKEIPYLCKLKQKSVHKGRPIFGYTYEPMFYLPFTILLLSTTKYVQCSLRYLTTRKSDVLYGRSLILWE